MKRLKKRLVGFALLAACGFAMREGLARESWPGASDDTKARLAEGKKHEDEVWAKIKPEIEEWVKKGKPYIPWAAKPSDLPQAEIPAFPGAEGGGMYSFGGRGGKVYVVTSLEDSGPGTFREACEAAGPRIVVFNVSGVIKLRNRIVVQAPYITIAGQTAPGDGVCISGNTVEIGTHDAVIRYMRFRRGATDVGDRNDGLGGDPIGNIIVDHCSCSWGFDENVSMYRHMYSPPDGSKDLKLPTCNITIEWTISSECCWIPTITRLVERGAGGTILSITICWRATPGEIAALEWAGILITSTTWFLTGGIARWMAEMTTRRMVNIINNYYKPGPITNTDAPIGHRIIKADSKRGKNIPLQFGHFYCVGNIVEGNEAVTKDNWAGGVQLVDEGDKFDSDKKPEEFLKKRFRV